MKGKTFLSDDNTKRGVIKHLRIIISEADAINEFLVVYVTTWHENVRGQDNTCVLNAGCHPFIKHKSWIDFSRSEAMNYAKIYNGIKKGLLIKKEDMPFEIINRIQKGAMKSEFFPSSLERFFEYF